MTEPPSLGKKGRVRWTICALLFAATAVNYANRQVIGLLKPSMKSEFGWTETDFGNIIAAFQFAYALGYLLAGRLIDGIGVRLGFALTILVWTAAAMAHAGISTVAGFCAARFVLGLAEGGNYPAGIKAVTLWFPRQERAFATGLFNAGCNVGALATPLCIPWITVHYGWRVAVFVAGSLGLVVLVWWWRSYRDPEQHPRLSPAELAYIRSGEAAAPVAARPDETLESVPLPHTAPKVRLWALLRYRQTWVFVIGMFLTSPIWWFYLFWVPGFLHDRHGLNLLELGPPLAVIYVMADGGSVLGGWASSRMIARGMPVGQARKLTMLLCAACVLPVFLAPLLSGLWPATLVIGLAAAGHQGWGCNLYTLVSDTAPAEYVGSIVGLGGLAAGLGGMAIAKLTGWVLDWTGSYLSLFILAAVVYPVALALMHWLNPRMERMVVTPRSA